MTIILHGMCYSGKSTLGKLLAERLGIPFLDSRDLFFREHRISEIEFFKTNFSAGNVPLWVDIKLKRSREHFIDFMEKINITCRPFWPAIYSQKAYRKYSTRRLRNTDEITSKNCISKNIRSLTGMVESLKCETSSPIP